MHGISLGVHDFAGYKCDTKMSFSTQISIHDGRSLFGFFHLVLDELLKCVHRIC